MISAKNFAALFAAAVAIPVNVAHAHEQTQTAIPSFAVTKDLYSLKDKERLQTACRTEFGIHAQVLNLDGSDVPSQQWSRLAPLFAGHHEFRRYTHYWALADSDYLDRLSSSRGVVVEYLWGDHTEPVIMGDAEMPSFLKVQVLCQLPAKEDEGSKKKPSAKKLTASSFGHWHVQTWSGDTLDFHNIVGSGATCDVVLVDSPHFLGGAGLRIAVRLQSTPMWSYMDAAVVQLGDETLEVQGKQHAASTTSDGNPYWINGLYQQTPLQVYNFPVEFQQLNARQREFKLDFGDGTVVSIRTFNQYVRVDVQTTEDSDMMEGSFGLLGSFPDGQWIGKDHQSMMSSPAEYGEEWMVDQQRSSKLFQSSMIDAEQRNTCEFQVVVSNKNDSKKQKVVESSVRRRLNGKDAEEADTTATQQRQQQQQQSNKSPPTLEDAQKACNDVHKGHPERIPFCVDGLMELVRDKQEGKDFEEGDFAEVFKALFMHSDQGS